ncbi:MAG: helix-turn-helix domain-containing protein [Gammaproteobacteria bacterium]|nr:helix-turn-helix domain-containing protein [Gammaproteobacteria bacterium]
MSLQAIPSASFRSREFSVRDQFDAWRERISVVFDVAPVADRTAGFAAEAEAWHLGEVVVVRTRFDGQRFVRTPRQLRSDLIDHYLVQLYCDGGYVGDVDDRGIEIRSGSVSVLDMSRPLETLATPAECVSLVIPRDVMRDALPKHGDLHGLVVGGASGALLADYIQSLERRLPGLEQTQAPRLVRATCDLIGACIAPSADSAERAREQIDSLRLEQISRLVDRELSSPGLSADGICSSLAISRTRLYEILKPFGGVRRYVQHRRLMRVHAALADPAETGPIMELGLRYGFTSHAHLTRAFREHFGYNPSDVRRDAGAVLRARASTAPVPAERKSGPGFDDWIRALRA